MVSSVKSNNELTVSMKLAKKTAAHKLLPTQWIKSLESLLYLFLDRQFDLRWKLIKSIFLNVIQTIWTGQSIKLCTGNQEEVNPNVIHIHGDKDTVFPLKILLPTNIFIEFLGNPCHDSNASCMVQ